MSLDEPPGNEEFAARRRKTFYPKSDLPFSQEEISRILRRKRARTIELQPEIARAAELFFAEKPISVEALPDLGTFHSLFKLSFSNESWFFRVDALDLFGRACEFLIDEQVCRILRSRDFPAPLVVKAETSRLGIEFDFEIIQAAPGVNWEKIEDRETQFIPEPILRDLGHRLADLHQVNVKGFGLLGAYPPLLAVVASWADYIHINLENHLDRCLAIAAISARERTDIETLFDRASALLRTAPCRLLHGDLARNNLFVEHEKVSCLIDWEDALGGDPVFDLAYWGTGCRETSRASLLAAYAERSPLPFDFEHRYWLYYLRIALSKTVHRWLFRHPERPSRPPASLRIQQALAKLHELGA